MRLAIFFIPSIFDKRSSCLDAFKIDQGFLENEEDMSLDKHYMSFSWSDSFSPTLLHSSPSLSPPLLPLCSCTTLPYNLTCSWLVEGVSMHAQATSFNIIPYITTQQLVSLSVNRASLSTEHLSAPSYLLAITLREVKLEQAYNIG